MVHTTKKIKLCMLTLALLGCTPEAPKPSAEVFVLGALGALHEREASFGFRDLDRAIRAIDADVIVLEVTPDELSERADTRGRPEYPRVVWPLLERVEPPTPYAMEPGPSLYDEINVEGAAILSEFAKNQPEANAALQAWTEATTNALLAYWTSPASTQDETTDEMSRARHALRGGLIPRAGRLQQRWDSAMVGTVRRAIQENPGSRVLIVGTFRNRFMLEDALREMPDVTVVDVEAWLEANVPAVR
jgi:hypothetical protein